MPQFTTATTTTTITTTISYGGRNFQDDKQHLTDFMSIYFSANNNPRRFGPSPEPFSTGRWATKDKNELKFTHRNLHIKIYTPIFYKNTIFTFRMLFFGVEF